MKIIELLNKIANGEEVPKKIKYDNIIFEYDGIYYVTEHTYLDEYCDISRCLNDTVEILEEEKKIPKKLNLDIDELRGKETPRTIDYLIESKLNEVLDFLKNKGE